MEIRKGSWDGDVIWCGECVKHQEGSAQQKGFGSECSLVAGSCGGMERDRLVLAKGKNAFGGSEDVFP